MHDLLTFGTSPFTITRYDALTLNHPAYQYQCPIYLEFAMLNIADITGNEKNLVIFHICALPQLYVKVGPPLEKFSGSAPVTCTIPILKLLSSGQIR